MNKKLLPEGGSFFLISCQLSGTAHSEKGQPSITSSISIYVLPFVLRTSNLVLTLNISFTRFRHTGICFELVSVAGQINKMY